MANKIGNVVLLEGAAFAQNQAGERRQLVSGGPVFEGERVVTAAGGRAELAFDQGGKILLAQAQAITLDSTVFDSRLSDSNSGALLPQPGAVSYTI